MRLLRVCCQSMLQLLPKVFGNEEVRTVCKSVRAGQIQPVGAYPWHETYHSCKTRQVVHSTKLKSKSFLYGYRQTEKAEKANRNRA